MSEEQGIVFDLNALTYNEVQKLDLLEPAEQEAYSIQLVAKAVTEWPFESDKTEAGIRELGLLDFMALQRAFNDALEVAFKRIE